MRTKVQAFLDRGRAGFYAVLVHALFVGVLLLTLDWAPKPRAAAPPSQQVVQAVVVDEARVAAEVERLRDQEQRVQAEQAARKQQLEEQARQAAARRQQEEQRLAELQQRLVQERQRHQEVLQQQQQAETKRLAALQQQQEQEAARLAELKKQQLALAKQRDQEAQQVAELAAEREQARQAKLEQSRRLLAAEQARAEAQRKQAEAERQRAEQAERKAEAERRKQQAELALKEQLANEQAALDQERARLREQHLAQYTAAIQAAVQRNWIRPAGTQTKLKCSVRVEQIPGGEVISAVVTSSCGSVALDRSVVEAVYRASPLPKPGDPALFDRELNFVFEPEG